MEWKKTHIFNLSCLTGSHLCLGQPLTQLQLHQKKQWKLMAATVQPIFLFHRVWNEWWCSWFDDLLNCVICCLTYWLFGFLWLIDWLVCNAIHGLKPRNPVFFVVVPPDGVEIWCWYFYFFVSDWGRGQIVLVNCSYAVPPFRWLLLLLLLISACMVASWSQLE